MPITAALEILQCKINNKVMKSMLTGALVTFLDALLLFLVIAEDNYNFSLYKLQLIQR